MASHGHGLVVGKFWPPTAGHVALIAAAAAACAKVSVVAMAAAWEDLPLDLRVRWLRELFAHAPHVGVYGIHDDVRVDYGDAGIWDAHMALIGLALAEGGERDPVDAVFTSEPYGGELARRVGGTHVCVDLGRERTPISGTVARQDPLAAWPWLPGPVRGWLARRVVVVGAESTGTTTLTRGLIDALLARGGVWAATRWVPEYGRAYTHAKLVAARAADPVADMHDLAWTEADFEAIARFQNAEEDAAARAGSPVVLCDTDAAATAIWHERYLGARSARVEAIAAQAPPRDLYLLTDHADVPFEQDGIRDGEHLRAWMTGRFKETCPASGTPTIVLSGPPERRLAEALAAIDGLLARRLWGDRTAPFASTSG